MKETQEDSLSQSDIIELEERFIVPTYTRPEMVFTHGEGVHLYDSQGKRYLDFASGIAVTALGHSDPEWVQAVTEQASRLVHVSNLYHTAPHVELAQMLVTNSFADRVFFCNSGAEANEAAIKFARKWAKAQGHPNKTHIVAFENGFHGRTVGSLSLTSKEKYREPFAPLMPGCVFAPYNDLEAARTAVSPETCAVIVEPVQGEGGIIPADPDFLAGLRGICAENNALLIFDEVQCGLGRSGHLWAHQAYGVTPDIMTLAKPLAGGLPIGATLVTEQVAQAMTLGDHGSTFAAGPLVCCGAQVVFNRINQPDFLANVRENGNYLIERLRDLPSSHIEAVRGVGLLIGVVFDTPVKPLIEIAATHGLLVINAGENVLRLCPPLIVSREQINQAVDILSAALKESEG